MKHSQYNFPNKKFLDHTLQPDRCLDPVLFLSSLFPLEHEVLLANCSSGWGSERSSALR